MPGWPGSRHGAGPRLPRGDRPQHDQPSRRAPDAAARYGIILIPGQEVTTEDGHAGALGDVGWIDFREPPDAWLDATERGGGLLSVNHPIGGHVSWSASDAAAAAAGRGVALELAGPALDEHAGLVAGLGRGARSRSAAATGTGPARTPSPGTPTTWVECGGDGTPPRCWTGCATAGARSPPAGTARCCCGWTASSSPSARDGTILAGPDGPRAVVRGDLAMFPAAAGYHRLLDPAGATLALTG